MRPAVDTHYEKYRGIRENKVQEQILRKTPMTCPYEMNVKKYKGTKR